MKSQMMTRPESASIRLSVPKPTSAIEPALIPAAIAIPNSTRCQPLPAHASTRARRCCVGRRKRKVETGVLRFAPRRSRGNV